MPKQINPSRNANTQQSAVTCIGLLVALGSVATSAESVARALFCPIAGELFRALPCILVMLCETATTCFPPAERLLVCFQWGASFGPALHFLARWV
jgi:hypothetical protein